MPTIAENLAEILDTVSQPGDFCVAGKIDLFAPGLEVEGVGAIALPLTPAQAAQLVAVAERAPFGRGEETLVDTGVRRTWQIAPDRVRIGGRHWDETLKAILARVAEGLGLKHKIAADFYKLLVYDEGSFFVGHRDTEKVPGMFGTLTIVLPSLAEGGDLIVRHKGAEVRHAMRTDDPAEAAFAAFYADCVHEVLPVVSGCRLTLIYNLVRKGRGPLPAPPDYADQQSRIAKVLRDWSRGRGAADNDAPEKLVRLLDHAYTPAELGFEALKGADAAVASVLRAACEAADCDLHLALFSFEETGSAEYSGNYRSRRRYRDDDEEEDDDGDFEIGEMFDRSMTLSHWSKPGGDAVQFDRFPVEDAEMVPPGVLDDLAADNIAFSEATGNEGASYERSYQRAALVLWPRHRVLAVLSQGGTGVTLPYLADLVERWQASREASLLEQARELSGHMLARWQDHPWHPRQSSGASDLARTLVPLTRLGEADRIEAFLTMAVRLEGHAKEDNPAIAGALRCLTQERAGPLLARLIAGHAARALGACGDLLARVAARGAKTWGEAAQTLVAALPGDRTGVPLWQRTNVEPSAAADAIAGLVAADPTKATEAAARMLAFPATYGIDTVILPAMPVLLGRSAAVRESDAVRRLRGACLAHLAARIAEPLEAPGDWRRDSAVGCKCARCAELSRFLADAAREVWEYRAAQTERDHVEGTIRSAHCDVDTTTDRRGRPYTLICRKNNASYQRRVAERTRDLADVATLAATA